MARVIATGNSISVSSLNPLTGCMYVKRPARSIWRLVRRICLYIYIPVLVLDKESETGHQHFSLFRVPGGNMLTCPQV